MGDSMLGDHVDILTGHPFKSAEFVDDGVSPRLLRGDNVVQRSLRWDGAKRYPVSLLESLDEYRLQAGDVVVAMDRPWIEAGLKVSAIREADEDAYLVQRVARLRATTGLDQGFLKWLLYSPNFTAHVLAVQTGSTVPHISQQQISEFRFLRPAIEEQRRIAKALGSFDDLIDTNRDLIASMEAIVTAEFDRLGFDASPGGSSVRLADLVDVNPRLPKPVGDAAYVDMAALPTRGSRIERVARRTAVGGARFQNGDALLARLTPCLENGKAALVDVLEEDEVGIGSTEFIVLRGGDAVGPEWPYLLTRSGRFREYAIRHMNGSSGRQRCSAESIAKYEVKEPSAAALARFRPLAAEMFAAISSLSDEIADLKQARDELLPLLLSGRVRVRDFEGMVA
ncbi:restriction endonuclease subunit S [Nocardioides xinjiangensis]|uniref:restriction endonuclease subunit S n=1 Tax=Nocardioides xinjiangensis TaxID=2817376 RepID=UPI001B3138E2|nr:restriction endonuclease subunit S [Nocardioides sp. SYSU D00778]